MTKHDRRPDDKPIRVLHLSGRSDHGGGPEHIFQTVLANLPGVNHHIACPPEGLYWKRYQALLGPERMCPLPHRSLSATAFSKVRRFALENHIQVIHSHGTCAGAYSRIIGVNLGIPVVHSFHGVPVKRSLKHCIYNLAERVLGPLTDRAIAVSPGEAALVHSRWSRYRGRLTIIPNGIDLGGELPVPVPWPGDGPLRIVSFTRRNYQKHPELLIEIARILHLQGVSFHMDAFGEGLAQSSLAEEAERRGVGHLLNFHGSTDVPSEALAGGHVYLSTSRWEGMPLAVLEAWRAGLVVVASDVVGNRDLVEDGQTGCLFPDGNGRAAARIIQNLLKHPAIADHYRSTAVRLARSGHCRNLMAMRLEWLYRHVFEGKDCQEMPIAAADQASGNRPQLQMAVL